MKKPLVLTTFFTALVSMMFLLGQGPAYAADPTWVKPKVSNGLDLCMKDANGMYEMSWTSGGDSVTHYHIKASQIHPYPIVLFYDMNLDDELTHERPWFEGKGLIMLELFWTKSELLFGPVTDLCYNP